MTVLTELIFQLSEFSYLDMLFLFQAGVMATDEQKTFLSKVSYKTKVLPHWRRNTLGSSFHTNAQFQLIVIMRQDLNKTKT